MIHQNMHYRDVSYTYTTTTTTTCLYSAPCHNTTYTWLAMLQTTLSGVKHSTAFLVHGTFVDMRSYCLSS